MSVVLVPHGDPYMKFGMKQLNDGTVRATSPCCGRVMRPEKDHDGATTGAICKGCGADWQELAKERVIGPCFEGRFHGGGDGTYSENPKIICSWIERTLGSPENIEINWT